MYGKIFSKQCFLQADDQTPDFTEYPTYIRQASFSYPYPNLLFIFNFLSVFLFPRVKMYTSSEKKKKSKSV